MSTFVLNIVFWISVGLAKLVFYGPACIMLQLCRLAYHRHYDGNVIFELESSRPKQSTAHDYQVHKITRELCRLSAGILCGRPPHLLS